MTQTIFITGTDTGAGKTYVASLLLKHYASTGKKVLGLKPIASDSYFQDGQLRNDDALLLSAASSIMIDYEITNPLAFEPAIAPHIAARQIQQTLNFSVLDEKLKPGLSISTDLTLIEGAGGWFLPLNDQQTFAQYIILKQFDIILVVGMRLGCINHALLTEHAILTAGGNLLGWIANQIDPNMACYNENLDTLKNMLHSPMLGEVQSNGNISLKK